MLTGLMGQPVRGDPEPALCDGFGVHILEEIIHVTDAQTCIE